MIQRQHIFWAMVPYILIRPKLSFNGGFIIEHIGYLNIFRPPIFLRYEIYFPFGGFAHILENAVAIELMRRGYELYVGVLFRSEIDFVAMKNGSPIYIQVTNNLSDPNTFKREVSPLIEIKDSYPKVILSRTHQPTYVHEGIHIVDVAEWMGGKVPLYDSVIY